MESYLFGEELWDVVGGDEADAPEETEENADDLKKWKVRNAKAEFVLKKSISRDLFDHITSCDSANAIWSTLDGLFNKKNEGRLQLLENDLANLTQGELSISQFFLKVKNLCSEISSIDTEGKMSEARVRRNVIRGLKKEYVPFVTSVQGWANQPSLAELENLLASQESLARQMAGSSSSNNEGSALFVKNKKFEKKKYYQPHDRN